VSSPIKCFCVVCSDDPLESYSEQYRHECEVRMIINMSSKEARREHLNGIEVKRGKAAADRIRTDLLKAWRKHE
jgi:hypothetical protein